ncbi:MAG: hypothetical protein JSR80_03045 [Verrucomicrobia bacterium]|nr:hypothetical protein [Verrucomicrobiota bacterium]
MKRLILTALVMCTSCGYHLREPSTLASYRTISVPYAKGDLDGHLTDTVVHAIARSGRFKYCSEGGELLLCISFADRGRENIGYTFDTNKAGKTVNQLVPNEGRLIVTVEVTVMDVAQDCIALGPFCVKAVIDYPFDPLSTDNKLYQESLGQFTPIDEAEEVARHPLYEEIAMKIVDFLTSAW